MIRICSVLIFLKLCSIVFGSSAQEKNEKLKHIKEEISSKCSVKYTSNCFLLDLSRLIDTLSVMNEFQVLPGIFVVTNRSVEMPVDIFEQALVLNQTEKWDIYTYVRNKLRTYLDSLSITWRIMDRDSAFSVRQISDDLITELLPARLTARGKKKNGKESVMWAAGAMAALGMSTLFAITGKAAIASLAALMFSLHCYFKGSGHSGYVAAAQTAYATPYKSQCAETAIDIGRDVVAGTGYKKRITDDYQRYGPVLNEPIRSSKPPAYHENIDHSYTFSVNAK